MKKTTASLLFFIGLTSTPAFAENNPADPYEGYNRAVFKFNDKADQYVLAPVARGYRKITPKPVRTGVSNFFNNLRDVVSFGSNVLRLDVKRASEDLVRVGINTTFGLGGLIDVAGAGGVPDNKNTLGDTFATWGWKNSNYFVVPLLGPSTVRDTAGNAITTVYPIKMERILTDIQKADPRWSVILLRYFNPIGAHQSGLIGEHPNGIPNNLLPYVCQVAGGKLPFLSVFGDDYPTPDGTGIRDYIHVVNLAEGHVAAMKAKGHIPGVHLLNLGSGRAYSVLEIVRAFEAASGLTIPYQIKPRREGDLACVYADPAYTKQQTGWETKRDLTQMMEDAWRWVKNNPNGYED